MAAMRIPVRQMSGEERILEVLPDLTLGDFKQQLKELQSSQDLRMKMSEVEVIVGDKKLEDDEQTLAEAGLGPEEGAEILFTIRPVECESQSLSGYAVERLKVVKIPNIERIQAKAFFNCDSLISVAIPDSVKIIGVGAFSRCTALISVTLAESLNIIGNQAFHSCISLDSINIPESVTAIGPQAFKNCRALKSVTIPNPLANMWDEVGSSFKLFSFNCILYFAMYCTSSCGLVLNSVDLACHKPICFWKK